MMGNKNNLRMVILRKLVVGVLMTSAAHAFVPTSSPIRCQGNSFLQQPRRLSTRTMDELPLVVTDKVTSSTNPNSLLLNETALIGVGRPEERHKFTLSQTFTRASTVAVIIAYIVNPQPFDDAIANVWSAIYNWGPAQQGLFEAEVASAGFFVSIAFFSILHLLLGEEKTKAARLDGQMPVDPLSWTRPKDWYLWFNPLASYLGSIWIYQQFHERPPMPEVAPTFGVFSIELLFGVFLYDLCFYPIHYLMHHSKFGKMRKVHGYHHRWSSHTLNSLETVQHSYIDGFLQVVVNIIVQHISPFGGPKHILSRLAHNIVVTYLLAEAHSGYNLPWMTHNIFPEFLGGSPRHDKHHHDGRVYYQQYFKYLDDFFGFTDERIEEKKTKAKPNLKKHDEELIATQPKPLEVVV